MKVKVIRQFLHPTDQRRVVQEGETIEVSESIARELENNKLIVREPGSAMRAKGPAQAGTTDPTSSPPSGGPTGEAEPASSSHRVHPRGRRASR